MKCRVRHETAGCARSVNRARRIVLSSAIATILLLLGTGSALASTVTVGSVLPPGSSPTAFGQVQTLFNTTLPEKGANLVAPVNGAIVRWRVQDAEGGPFRLRVLRPTGSGAYTAVGTSNPATPSGPGLQTFSANLPIRAGDLIGIDPSNADDKIGIAEVPGAGYGFIFPPPFDTATVGPSGSVSGKEIQLSAEVQPAPAIGPIAPGSGSIAGGDAVTLTGTNLNAASAVKFGSTPASGFTVDSETQITAIAPPSATVGTVPVTVTTLAGTSNSTLFNYEGCVVPSLRGKALQRGRQILQRANCKLGAVKRRKGKRGKLIRQNPMPGKILAPESKVNVVLGK